MLEGWASMPTVGTGWWKGQGPGGRDLQRDLPAAADYPHDPGQVASPLAYLSNQVTK